MTAANTVTIPAWLLVGLIDCHHAMAREVPCEFVAAARGYLSDLRSGANASDTAIPPRRPPDTPVSGPRHQVRDK